MGWNALWSLIVGLAVYSNKVLFIFARVFQSIGPAMTLPNSLAVLGSLHSASPKKATAFAVFGGTAPFRAITGFATGGLSHSLGSRGHIGVPLPPLLAYLCSLYGSFPVCQLTKPPSAARGVMA